MRAHTLPMPEIGIPSITVRLTDQQDALVRAAAALTAGTVEDFAAAATVSRAREELAEQRLFTLDDEDWADLTTVLDRPVVHKPRLARLFTEDSIFG